MRQSVVGNRVATGSAGVGFAFRLVAVDEVLPSLNICNAHDVKTGEIVQVGLNKRGRDAWPQVGDQWVLNRSQAGHWMLAIKITDTQPPVATANLDTEPDLGALVTTLGALGLVTDQTAHQGFGWQVPGVATGSSIGTGWALGPVTGSIQPCRFRLHRNHLEVVGALHTTTSSPSATVLTLGTGFAPGSEHRMGVVTNVGGTITARMLDVGTSGSITVTPALTAASTDIYLSVWVPMEAITP